MSCNVESMSLSLSQITCSIPTIPLYNSNNKINSKLKNEVIKVGVE